MASTTTSSARKNKVTVGRSGMASSGGASQLSPLGRARRAHSIGATHVALAALLATTVAACSKDDTAAGDTASTSGGSTGASTSTTGTSGSSSGSTAGTTGGTTASTTSSTGTGSTSTGATTGATTATTGATGSDGGASTTTAGSDGGADGGTVGGTAGPYDGGYPAGQVAGTATRPQLTDTQAPNYTILKYLAQNGGVTAPTVDNWDPTAGVGDVSTFTPTFTVAATGGTHTTVGAAVAAAVAMGGANRIYIQVMPGTYREVVCVTSGGPPITLYSTNADASQTTIVYNNYAGEAKDSGMSINPCAAPSATSTTYGTSGSATFAAYATGFQAKNITFSNDTDETGMALTSNAQAVALMTQGDKMVFENVRVLGNQDTLYVKSSTVAIIQRAYFKSSYIEGDVDFIFGRATFVLDGCTIKYLTARQGSKGGNLVAPSTDARNTYGILVINSTLTAETGTPDNTIGLGRAWDEGSATVAAYATAIASGTYPNGQALFRNNTVGSHIRSASPWLPSASSARPYSSTDGTYPANRLYEYANTGPGSAVTQEGGAPSDGSTLVDTGASLPDSSVVPDSSAPTDAGTGG